MIDATAGASGNSLSLDIGTAGTDRVVVVFGSDEASSSQITGVTVDGKSCTAVHAVVNPDGLGNLLEGWVILESALGASNGVVTVALTGADTGYGIVAAKMSGVVQSVNDSNFNNTAVTGPGIPVTGIDCPADGHVIAAYSQGTADLTCSYTSPLVQDEIGDPSSGDLVLASGTETAAQTNKTYTGTWSASFNRGCGMVMTFAVIPPVSYEQEGYRFRNDDGSESTATWKAAQDTDITLSKDVPARLRMLVDVTGAPGAVTRTLQYRRVGDADTEWETVS